MTDIFEKAARLKVRFSYNGVCSVEDLFDIPLTGLDKMYKVLNTIAKAQQEDSLLETKTNEDRLTELKINLIKHVFETRTNENLAKAERKAKADKKKKILGIIAEKQDKELYDKNIDDLKKLIEED